MISFRKIWMLVLMLSAGTVGAGEALRWTTVTGSSAVPLTVVQAGRKDGPGILFLHGFSQSALSWQAQLADPALQQAFHMVALDLRGHGNSGKPWRTEDYTGDAWAQDIAAVMDATGLDRPVLVAWSFGGLVAMHYLRRYGAGGLSGLQFVGSVGQLVPQPPPSAPRDSDWLRDMLSDDSRANLRAGRQSVRQLTAGDMPGEWTEQTLAAYLMMPVYAKRAIGVSAGDNADLVMRLNLPVRFSGGSLDVIVPPEIMRSAAAVVPNASLKVYEGAGHSPFAEQSAQFNVDLTDFVKMAQGQ